jgi:hypothetical protein
MRTPLAFVFGALAATLIAAAAFRGGGQPVDSTFTYQGQLRNAGQLVNGNVDVRFTLWDSDVGGTQVGNANSFTNYPLTDGRFALGLNFGTGAFNGDQRWVQVEFRSPAGVGQYLTLNPRDKIMATPYALYALNGTASQWNYNPKTQALTAAANVSKVGIGTSTPTAALEVVSATGGDDAVKLPAGSIGAGEISGDFAPAATFTVYTEAGSTPVATREIIVPSSGKLVVFGKYSGQGGDFRVLVDDTQYVTEDLNTGNSMQPIGKGTFVFVVPVTAGPHRISCVRSPYGYGLSVQFTVMLVHGDMPVSVVDP